jgi:outer membrane protein OmpA-like peptidoglycan-associated protein
MSNTPLNITVDATDTLGIVHNWQSTIQTERITLRKKKELRIKDTLIERFALILFEFDKSSLSPMNQRIAQEIKKSIKYNSRVAITGYADIIGDSTYNYTLSEARCKEVARFLNLVPGTYSIKPFGGKIIPFENETPQGRAYSRTVMIEVKTPIIEGK